ncbi:MAG: hypothetical protein JNM19_18020 [Chitinophagaceae bacterium]|nr:hypothetical protein [Chitinophagaceae bacterium]
MPALKHFFLALLCWIPTGIFGQQLLFDSYSFSEGLTSSNVQKTIQDPYGFIWIGTQDGLFRFNGTSFDILKKSPLSNSLGENFVFDICNGPGDTIYAAVFPTGIDAINIRTLGIKQVTSASEKLLQQLPNQWIQKLCFTNGKLWVGGNDFIACLDRSGQQQPKIFTSIPGINTRLDISFILPLGNSLLMAGIRSYGVVLFDPVAGTVINTIPSAMLTSAGATESINDAAVSGNTIVLAFDHRVETGSFNNTKWQPVSSFATTKLQSLTINAVAIDKNGNTVWLGTDNGLGKLLPATGEVEIITPDPTALRPLKDELIAGIFIDRSDNLWISSSKLLQVTNLRQSPFRAFSGKGDTKLLHIYTIDTLSSKEVITTGKNGLFVTNVLTSETKLVPGSSGQGTVHHIQKLDNGRYFVFTDNGLFVWEPAQQKFYSGNQLDQLYPEWKPHREKIVNNAVRIGEVVYFASDEQEGLLKWDMNSKRISQFKKGGEQSGGLPENHIHNLKLDRDNNLWLLQDFFITRFDYTRDSAVQVFAYKKNGEGPSAGIYFDLFDDGKKIWFSTYGGGINSWDKQLHTWDAITEKDGLCNNSVYSILPERDSFFWVSSNMGISRVNYFTKACENFFVEDGLQDNAFDEKGYFKNGDLLYLGGINGFTEINTALFRSDRSSFPVYIYKIDYYRGGNKFTSYELNWEKLKLPSAVNLVTLYCAALKFPGSHRVKFYYRLKGTGTEYLPVNNDNKIDLLISKPGNYEIEISYQRESGGNFEAPLVFRFYVKPKWHQSWWFKVLLGFCVAGIAYSLYRMRINQLKKEHQIRTKLASDLHDDLGSTMNSVKVYANLAIMEKQADKYLPLIKEGTQDAISGIRDIIWVLDDSKDSLDHLLSRISLFAAPLCEASKTRYKTDIADNARDHKLEQEERRNLYMMTKEAVNNAVKYSGSQSLTIIVTANKGKPSLVIKDDGKGFDTTANGDGNGLKNMQRRAGEIGYKVIIQSAPGKGTSVLFEKS